jgi:uncharacterized protein
MNEPESLSQVGQQLLFSFFLSGLSYYLGKRWGIWNQKISPPKGGVIWHLIIGIVIVIGSAALTGLAYSFIFKDENLKTSLENPLYLTWYQFIYLFLSLLLLTFLLKISSLNLWSVSHSQRRVSEFAYGILALIFTIPFVMFMNALAKLGLGLFGVFLDPRQGVLLLLEEAAKDPLSCILMTVSIVFLVPAVEEIIFRGLIQNWLKRKIGAKWGLPLSIILFTLAHFSVAQGLDNIEILATLLVVSFFLTLLYEKRGTLWAPYGLHVAFNALTSITVIIQSGA